MSIPRHYHAYTSCWLGRGWRMLSVKLSKAEIRRQQERGRKVVTRRWWKTRQAADAALRKSGETGFVRECDHGDDCPERMAVLSN